MPCEDERKDVECLKLTYEDCSSFSALTYRITSFLGLKVVSNSTGVSVPDEIAFKVPL